MFAKASFFVPGLSESANNDRRETTQNRMINTRCTRSKRLAINLLHGCGREASASLFLLSTVSVEAEIQKHDNRLGSIRIPFRPRKSPSDCPEERRRTTAQNDAAIMVPNAKLLLTLLTCLLPLTSALFVPPSLLLNVLGEKDTDLLGQQQCRNGPGRHQDAAASVDDAHLFMAASRFCSRAAAQLPEMRPLATMRGNGRGVPSELHFEMRWVGSCGRGRDVKKQDTRDPLGKGKVASPLGQNWCTKLLVDNWKNCDFFLFLF